MSYQTSYMEYIWEHSKDTLTIIKPQYVAPNIPIELFEKVKKSFDIYVEYCDVAILTGNAMITKEAMFLFEYGELIIVEYDKIESVKLGNGDDTIEVRQKKAGAAKVVNLNDLNPGKTVDFLNSISQYLQPENRLNSFDNANATNEAYLIEENDLQQQQLHHNMQMQNDNKIGRRLIIIAIVSIVFVILALGIAMLFQPHGAKISGNEEYALYNQKVVEQEIEKLKAIQSFISLKEATKVDTVDSYIMKLRKVMPDFTFTGEMHGFNIKALHDSLQNYPVVVQTGTIYKSWIDDVETKRNIKTITVPYSKRNDQKPIKTLEITTNAIQQKAKRLRDEYYWPKNECLSIAQRHVWIGMSDTQLRKSLGSPKSVNRTVTAFGSNEQWVYGDFGPYIYVDNGSVTSWQD